MRVSLLLMVQMTHHIRTAPTHTFFPGEPVVPKHNINSFVGTSLADVLKQINRKQLLVIGFMTHMCVTTTVRGMYKQKKPSLQCLICSCCGATWIPMLCGWKRHC